METDITDPEIAELLELINACRNLLREPDSADRRRKMPIYRREVNRMYAVVKERNIPVPPAIEAEAVKIGKVASP